MEGLVQVGCGESRSIGNEDGDDWKRNNGEVDISGVNQPFQFFDKGQYSEIGLRNRSKIDQLAC